MTIANEFQVTGMSCSHCEASVRQEVAKLPGVEGIEVSAQTGRLVVTSTAPLADAAGDPAVSRAVAALLPAGATGQDARREAVASRAGARDASILTGRPIGQ